MDSLDVAFEKLKNHSSENLGEGNTEIIVTEAEHKLGITFPNSYRRFLLEIGYAEVYGDEIYSNYDTPDEIPCLGIVQQNIGKSHLSEGFLEILSTDLDGVFYISMNDGGIYINSFERKTFNSFEEMLLSLLHEYH